jgi:hypothetical protein
MISLIRYITFSFSTKNIFIITPLPGLNLSTLLSYETSSLARTPGPWVLPTVLDLVTEVKRKVSWRRPRPELGCRAKGKKCSSRFFTGICCNRHGDTLVRLNPSSPQFKSKFLDALYLICVFQNKQSFHPPLIVLIYGCLVGQSENIQTLDVRHRARFSPLARYVSVANAVSRQIDILTEI